MGENIEISTKVIENQEIRFRCYKADSTKIAVLAHPYAFLGGSVDDINIIALSKKINSKGFTVYVLDATTRRSALLSGKHDTMIFTLFVKYITSLNHPEYLLLGGYSYGARISMHKSITLAIDKRISHVSYLFLAPYLGLGSSILSWSWGLGFESFSTDSKVLFVWPDNDEFTREGTFETTLAKLKNRCPETTPLKLTDCSHMLSPSSRKILLETVDKWLASALNV
ncbi:Protein disulfide isomerase [Schizosaccharomyces pombe]|uniref:Uncharacterized protein C959.06c n=1 Tax=Schizosaccharomyces pombe (strain 972 / ATCC 24843) TaxID=284812 RepID=YKV6_SCHPO|nr:uncharacterized protein SPAC959.06c [Schizosaccharomyces pombe]P0CS92.1 RecName: Full=Uncharacterized protein C959.06c [Schizosaccharomyces pombe 972h-]CAB93013.1 conserved fungal protein [Schizosaccharomyces pombe]|eukprot:NP_594173.1 uncharacterized protein SPAC959.06c [Schizosaccharomyces pombe]